MPWQMLQRSTAGDSIVPHQRSEACNPKAFKPLNGILLNPVQKQEHYSDLEVVSDRAHQAPELDLRHQPDKEAAFADEKQYAAPATPQQRICGMRKSIAYSLFAIIGLLIVGAVVGGAVGGTQASSHKNSSPTSSSTSAVSDTTSTSLSTPATTSTTATTSTVSTASPSATPIGPGEGTYTCPQSNNEDYTTSSGTGSLTFRQLCDVDWPVGVTALAGSATDTVEDLSTVLEYSLEQCIEQCAVYSINNSPGCMAVTYGANVTLAQGRGIGGNCFLKSARGASNLADDSGQAQSAYLITG